MANPWEEIKEDAYRTWLQNAPMSAEEFNNIPPMDRRRLRTDFEQQNETAYHRQKRQAIDLSDYIPDVEDSRRSSLEAEKEDTVPEVGSSDRAKLGMYLKFVNREASINELLKHAASQYINYTNGMEYDQLQWAACSGGPGLGKTTFCRKAFTRAADVADASDSLWENVEEKNNFFGVVKTCVEKGRQYRINYSSTQTLNDNDIENPAMSLARRIVKQCMKSTKTTTSIPLKGTGNGLDQLRSVISRITGGDLNALVVINIDETNELMKHSSGQDYLFDVLAAVSAINAERKSGFLFCIMSGTNVRHLHDLLRSSSSLAPQEIPLPLLESQHVIDILNDMSVRLCRKPLIESKRLNFVVEVLGGVPRYIEMLVYCLGEIEQKFSKKQYCAAVTTTQEEWQPHQMLDRIKDTMNAQYGRFFADIISAVPCEVLVAHSLFQWPVNRDLQFGKYTVGELEGRGIVFLQGSGRTQTMVYPLVLLLNISQVGYQTEVPMLLKNFDVMLSSDENERNTLAVCALKCSAWSAMETPKTLSDLFPLDLFPNVPKEWHQIGLLFDRIKVHELDSRVNVGNWEEALPVLTAKKESFLKNCNGATFADMLIIPTAGDFVIFIQEKQVENAKRQREKDYVVPTTPYKKVKAEHAKCDVSTQHLFVFITDEEFTERDSLEENEIVLSYREHTAAIGPLLSLLRQYNHAFRPPRVEFKGTRAK